MALQIFNVGQVYFEQEQYEKALKYFEWALTVVKRSAEAANDPNAGKILCYLGKTLLKQGRVEEAKDYLNSAQEIFQIQLPADHPFIKDYQTDIENLDKELKSEN